jgi:hypothetical protein
LVCYAIAVLAAIPEQIEPAKTHDGSAAFANQKMTVQSIGGSWNSRRRIELIHSVFLAAIRAQPGVDLVPN